MTISTNIAAILRSQLKRSGCRVYTSDALVRIEATNSFYFPDVVVDCGKFDKNALYTSTPTVIFEVLSRSTAMTDRREKLIAYKKIPTLSAYVIVQQAWKCVELHKRLDGEAWSVEEFDANEEFALELC